MKKILILMGRYLPGHKDGGPLRTIANVTDALGDEYDFYIGCLDRDHGDTEPYPNIKRNEWNQVGKAKVWYVEPGGFTNKLILKLAEGKDSIYLTSFYDDYGYKTLLLKKRGRIKKPVALASMGVFSEGALAQKSAKKKLFISGCKALGLFKDITWSVTSEMEANEMKKALGQKPDYIIAEDLPRSTIPGYHRAGDTKRVVFLSRISPKKNLLGAIKALKRVPADITFDIYGPCENEQYWNECKEELQGLSCQWNYMGDVQSEKVQEVFSDYDIFLFPTLGENYGHVIFESLSVGCIPIISEQTPWKEIQEEKAGIILPLNNLNAFGEAIVRILNLSPEERKTIAMAGVQIAKKRIKKNQEQTGYRKIFG